MSKNNDPRISVIIPVYNAEKYLNQCVDSVLAQSMPNIEVLLVDDGSTDSSGAICDAYSNKDERVVSIHIENQGVSNARNVGIVKAKGDYLMFLDSDDWIALDTCEVSFAEAEKKRADVVFWSWYKVSTKGTIREQYLQNHSEILVRNDLSRLRIRAMGLTGNELRDPTKTDVLGTPWAKLYRRKLLVDQNLLFVERKKVGMEDVLFNIEVFQHVKRIGYVERYLNFYRIDNPNSLSKVDAELLASKFSNLFSAIEKYVTTEDLAIAFNNRKIVSLINILLSITSPRSSKTIWSRRSDVANAISFIGKSADWKAFNLKALPLHWRVFFSLAKGGAASALLAMSYLMRILR